jgi:uncharacterized radical SAM superfamily protein
MFFISKFFNINEGLNDGGTCFPDAYHYFIENQSKDKNLRLVHTIVNGQGPLEGIKFNHAFLVSKNKVIDPSQPKRKEFPKDLYFAVGGIDPKGKLYFEYSFEDTLEKVQESGTYGPWEKILFKYK